MGDIVDRAYFQSAFDRRRVAELLDDGSGVSGTIIDDLIAAAEVFVRNYLSKQYTLAQLQADASIKRAVVVMAMYNLELRRSDVSAGIAKAYADTMSYLASLIEGDAKLNAVDQVLPRITQYNSTKVFEQSDYFVGLPEDPTNE